MNGNANRLWPHTETTDPTGPTGPDAAEFAELIEQSSLGSPAARALRDRVDQETAQSIAGTSVWDSLAECELAGTWHEQLLGWLSDAVRAGIAEPNAMVLATANVDGLPATRTVLAKGLDERGLVFFTNYTSAKSHDLAATRYASATFPWYTLHRQATVRGTVERVSAAEAAAYWATRPRGSQLGAWASPQSRVVSGRGVLDAARANMQRRFADVEHVPMPPHWGGWRIRPESVEFWQGHADRMHDRLRFTLTQTGWHIERVAP